MNSVGLLAPSCCKNPAGLLASGLLVPTSTLEKSQPAPNETFSTADIQAYRMEIFYCQAASSNIGCQRLIQDRATRFTFSLRLTLLLLLALLFLNVVTQASLDQCSQQQQQRPQCDLALDLTEALARHQSRTTGTTIAAAAEATGSNGSDINTLCCNGLFVPTALSGGSTAEMDNTRGDSTEDTIFLFTRWSQS